MTAPTVDRVRKASPAVMAASTAIRGGAAGDDRQEVGPEVGTEPGGGPPQRGTQGPATDEHADDHHVDHDRHQHDRGDPGEGDPDPTRLPGEQRADGAGAVLGADAGRGDPHHEDEHVGGHREHRLVLDPPVPDPPELDEAHGVVRDPGPATAPVLRTVATTITRIAIPSEIAKPISTTRRARIRRVSGPSSARNVIRVPRSTLGGALLTGSGVHGG